MNIPIYRAKKIDSDDYLEGDLHNHGFNSDEFTIYERGKGNMICNRIDPSTLAINFTDMIDSQGNKIFASLSEDGKGGDIDGTDGEDEMIFLFKKGQVGITHRFHNDSYFDSCIDLELCKVIGIQK